MATQKNYSFDFDVVYVMLFCFLHFSAPDVSLRSHRFQTHVEDDDVVVLRNVVEFEYSLLLNHQSQWHPHRSSIFLYDSDGVCYVFEHSYPLYDRKESYVVFSFVPEPPYLSLDPFHQLSQYA